MYAGLVLSGNTLYGVADTGGSAGNGTVFAVNTDGSGFTGLHTFTSAPGPFYTNRDGVLPIGRLVLSGSTLYGTTQGGGAYGHGTVFALNPNGSGFTNLHSFPAGRFNADGAAPQAGLILSGSTLYGTAYGGGAYGCGTVFALNTNGSGFTNLHSFTALTTTAPPFTMNSDGAQPFCDLVLSGNTLYGTASVGGPSGYGTVFAVNTDGSGFTVLHNFDDVSDGATPYAGVILSDNTLYGTASVGGPSGYGTVFAVNTNGTGFRIVASSFGGGDAPYGALVLSGNTLYGTTSSGGGDSYYGTVFAVNIDGSGSTSLHGFDVSAGGEPHGALVLSGNTLYGTTPMSEFGSGSVFSLAYPPPHLAIMLAGTNVVLTWTNIAPVFYLKSTPNLNPPVIWSFVSPLPVVIGPYNFVTNAIIYSANNFYKLSL